MRRVELVCNVADHPEDLYDSVSTVDMEFEEPELDRKPAVKAGKKSRDIKLLSESLGRLKLCRRKTEKSRVRKENGSKILSSSLVDICDSNSGVLDVACTEETQHTEMQPVEMQTKLIQPTEMQPKPLELLEMQRKEIKPVETQAKQILTVEMQHMQIKPTEIQSKEMKPVETQAKQILQTQVQSKEMELLEMRPKEMQHVEMQLKEKESVEMQPKETEPVEKQPRQIQYLQVVQSKEMQRVEMQRKEKESVEIQPKEREPVETQRGQIQYVQAVQSKEMQLVEMQPKEMESVEMQSMQIRPTEIQSKEMECVETQPKQIQPAQVQSWEMQPKEMESEEMQTKELESMEMQAKEVQPLEMQNRQIQPTEVQPREVKPIGTQPKEIEYVETQPKHIQNVGMQLKEMMSMEMKPVDMQPKQIQSIEIQPVQMQQKIDEAAFVDEKQDFNDNSVLDSQKTFSKAGTLPQCKTYVVADNEDAVAKQQYAPLQLKDGTDLFTPKDDVIGPVSDLPSVPSGSFNISLNEESGGNVDDSCMDDVLSIYHSRSPSICSYSPDSHSVDDWGCENQEPSGNVDQPSDDEWIEIESTQDLDGDSSSMKNTASNDGVDDNVFGDSYDGTHNKAKETVQAWLNDRKKFCRNSKNFHFHEYVVDNINPKKPKKSLTQSLLSLDSAFSSTSALSSISREQRHINEMSGLFGYGNFDKYNKEYLSKLRADRLTSKRRLKPYDVARRKRRDTRSRATSPIGSQNGRDDFAQRRCSKTVICTEERVRKQTYSETVSFDESKSHAYRHVTSTVCKSSSWYFRGAKVRDRGRSYSETDFKPQRSRGRRMSDSNSKRRRFSSQRRRFSSPSSVESSSGRCTTSSLRTAFKDRTLSKEGLYSCWQNRREDYMKARYMGSSSRHKSQNSLALTGYTCGICFKSFETRTRREQHSDELMHWACITCGRFFASHTALGQHVDEMGHRKD